MKFAVKKLTRSDLTLFDAQLHRQNAGKQKSINLNRRTFVDALFPGARARAGGAALQFRVGLRILGPNGIAEVHQLSRKIVAAGGRQKNWRLNGETIHDTPNGLHPGRYDHLQADDFALMGFEGEDFPDIIDLTLISARPGSVDEPLHRELVRLTRGRSMVVLTAADLAALHAVATTIQPGHPVEELVDPDGDVLLEEAALGSVDAVRRLRRRGVRRQTAEELAAARERAMVVGRDGEVLIAGYLRRREQNGKLQNFVWESEINATNPWDMTYRTLDGTLRRVEVKSTSGPHDRDLHVSQAEIAFAAEDGAPRTEVWRVSNLNDRSGVLRRSTNFRAEARRIMELCEAVGEGLKPDGWTLNVSRLTWGEPQKIRFRSEPDE